MRKSLSLAGAILAGVVLAGGWGAAPALAAAPRPTTATRRITAATLAARIRRGQRPVILQVGFQELYEAAHIPGAQYAGPASQTAGMARLKAALAKLPRGEAVILYCGCCPWAKCPNIRPAAQAARRMGFRHLEVLYLPDSFARDWVRKGYPIAGRDAR